MKTLALDDLFFPNPSDGLSRDLEISAALTKLRGEVADRVQAGFWKDAGPTLAAGLHQLCNVSVLDLLVSGWAKHRELAELVRKTKNPDELVQFDLGEHEITSTHKPKIELTYLGARLGTLEFEIEVAFKIAFARLHVRGDRIVAASAGDCVAEGSCKLAGVELAKLASPKVPLPGELRFGEGFRIPFVEAATSPGAPA
jgi:hypothetical protein